MEITCQNRTPFAITRAIVSMVIDRGEDVTSHLDLRSVFHTAAPEDSSLSDRQAAEQQLRFYTRRRCLRDLRSAAIRISSVLDGHVEISITDFPGPADADFLSLLMDYTDVIIRTNRNIAAKDATPPHREDLRALDDMALVSKQALTEAEWDKVRNRVEHYLNCGDSWTAVWLAEKVLSIHSQIPYRLGDVFGLAFGLQDRSAEAEKLFQEWETAGGINQARANYSLSMLYARHHPSVWRDDKRAELLLDLAWQELSKLSTTEAVLYERIFNRNGLALLLYRQKLYGEAIELLEDSIARLENTPYAHGVHHTVLLNNLGRVYAEAGNSGKAEECLRAAVEMDPKFSEYWIDLANFYIEQGRHGDAADAADIASHYTRSIPEVFALQGFITAEQGDHRSSAAAYRWASTLEPSNVGYLLAAARAYAELEDYASVEDSLWHINRCQLEYDERAEAELLRLELDINRDRSLTTSQLRERIEDIAARYPNSALVQKNVLALTQG